jgi:hypothetical protein
MRGTPFLLRSFRTLLMEESSTLLRMQWHDRLYAPMILATMGIENMGDGEPWIPSQAELDDLRNDMQSALAADFKLLVHNMGVKVDQRLRAGVGAQLRQRLRPHRRQAHAGLGYRPGPDHGWRRWGLCIQRAEP